MQIARRLFRFSFFFILFWRRAGQGLQPEVPMSRETMCMSWACRWPLLQPHGPPQVAGFYVNAMHSKKNY